MSSAEISVRIPEGSLDSSWHVLYTRHQHEKTVARALSGKGFDVFLPLYSAIHRWRDRNKEVSLPLFPSYVFVRGGLNRSFEILATPGVHHVVAWAGKPASVQDAEIETVRRTLESSLPLEPHPFLRCGDRVRVKAGPLEGVEGLLVYRKNSLRLVLSVQLLEKSVAVEVETYMIEGVTRPSSLISELRPAPNAAF